MGRDLFLRPFRFLLFFLFDLLPLDQVGCPFEGWGLSRPGKQW
jgi:hypothetical protein